MPSAAHYPNQNLEYLRNIKYYFFSLHLSDNFTIYIACGPFATSDTLSYNPLSDFLKVVEDERPDLLVLVSV